jgi:hypothetical protein
MSAIWCKADTVIHMFKVFLLPIQAECRKVARVYAYFQGNIYLFVILYLTARLVANFELTPLE